MVFVPSVSAIMADFGADVVKIEPPGVGDMHRYGHQIPGMPVSDNPYVFQVDNRSKKSLSLDLKAPEGLEVFRKLISRADVFLTNYRTSASEKLGLTYDDLEAVNSRLIYARGTGHGERGPEAEKPGYDSVSFWSRSAMETHMLPERGAARLPPYGTGDHPSGLALLSAVMMALYQRERTGEGVDVSVSLLGSGAWVNSNMLMAALCGAEFQPRRSHVELLYAFRHYKTSDDRILKLGINDHERLWEAFCHAISRDDLINDTRFGSLTLRNENTIELNQIIDAVFLQRSIADWDQALGKFDIPFSPLPTYQEVAEDPQMIANDILVDVNDPQYGKFQMVNSPLEYGDYKKVQPTAAPRLGEHSREVLFDLGYSREEIDRLIENGSIQEYQSLGLPQ